MLFASLILLFIINFSLSIDEVDCLQFFSFLHISATCSLAPLIGKVCKYFKTTFDENTRVNFILFTEDPFQNKVT